MIHMPQIINQSKKKSKPKRPPNFDFVCLFVFEMELLLIVCFLECRFILIVCFRNGAFGMKFCFYCSFLEWNFVFDLFSFCYKNLIPHPVLSCCLLFSFTKKSNNKRLGSGVKIGF